MDCNEIISKYECVFLLAVSVSSLMISLTRTLPCCKVPNSSANVNRKFSRTPRLRGQNLISYRDNNTLCEPEKCPLCRPGINNVFLTDGRSAEFPVSASGSSQISPFRAFTIVFSVIFISVFIWTSDDERVTRILQEKKGAIGLIARISRPFFNFGEWINLMCCFLVSTCIVLFFSRTRRRMNRRTVPRTGFQTGGGVPQAQSQSGIGGSCEILAPGSQVIGQAGQFLNGMGVTDANGQPVNLDPMQYPMPLRPWCSGTWT